MTRRHLVAALALAALAVAGALAANLVLIGLATERSDPVGRLRPVVAVGPGGSATVDTGTTPVPTVGDRTDGGHGHDGDEDD